MQIALTTVSANPRYLILYRQTLASSALQTHWAATIAYQTFHFFQLGNEMLGTFPWWF